MNMSLAVSPVSNFFAGYKSMKQNQQLHIVFSEVTWGRTQQLRLSDGSVRLAEIHWFEAHGIGKKNIKVKHYL